MKCGDLKVVESGTVTSHPTRGAWIEILLLPPTEAASCLSHPTRGAWIEISNARKVAALSWKVAPHPGCVD